MESNTFPHSGAEKRADQTNSLLPPDSAWKQNEPTGSWQFIPPIIATGQLPVVRKKIVPLTEPPQDESTGSWQFIPPIITAGHLPVVPKNAILVTEPLQGLKAQREPITPPLAPYVTGPNHYGNLLNAGVEQGQAHKEPLARRLEGGDTHASGLLESAPLVKREQAETRPIWLEDAFPELFGEYMSGHLPAAMNVGKPMPDKPPVSNGQTSGWQRGVKPGLPPTGYVSHWDKWENPRTLQSSRLSSLWHALMRLAPTNTSTKEYAQSFLHRPGKPGFASLVDGLAVTLAPLFTTAFLTHRPSTTFLVGTASAFGVAGARILFDFTEVGKSGRSRLHSAAMGLLTFLGGMIPTLPFLLPNLQLAFWTIAVIAATTLLTLVAIYSTLLKSS